MIFYSVGILAGAVTSLLCNLLLFFYSKAITKKTKNRITMGYFLRLLIYGGVFILVDKYSRISGILYLVSILVGMGCFVIFMGTRIKRERYRFLKIREIQLPISDVRNEIKFINSPVFEEKRGGKTYKTFHRFRKYKRIR